jgi:ribosomal protein L16 Arg81 hydroxylase
MGFAHFRSHVWQQCCALIRNAFPVSELPIGYADIDALLLASSPAGEYATVRYVNSSDDAVLTEVAPTFANGCLSLSDAYQRYADGYTIVIHQLERLSPPIARLATSIGMDWVARVSAGIYLTPPSSKALAAHFDRYDHFILQLGGRKRWLVYDRASVVPRDPVYRQKETPTRDDTLCPGDVLYLPQATPHEAHSLDNEPSLHLTIAVHATSALDVALEAVRIAARRTFALTANARMMSEPAIHRVIQSALDVNLTNDVVAEAVTTMSNGFCNDVQPHIDGHFASIDRARALRPDTVVKRRYRLITVSNADPQICIVRFPGNVIAAPPACALVISAFMKVDRMRVSDFPGRLSSEAKLVLAKRLVVGGLLSVDELS